MSFYRIVCTEQTHHSNSGHILNVGTGAADAAGDLVAYRWSVSEVWAAIDAGHTFHTYGGGAWANVEKYYCTCGSGSLRSKADATSQNNLDNLKLCNWAA